MSSGLEERTLYGFQLARLAVTLVVDSGERSTGARHNRTMSLDIADAIRHEHNATLEAVQPAQARALHLGTLLLELRQELGPVAWET